MKRSIEELTLYYRTLRGEVHALESTTFSIADGEIVGLAGESGCGKTTLGNGLISLNPPMKYIAGRVLLDNVELPIWDNERMDEYRFKKISIIPSTEHESDPKIGRMTEELHSKSDYQAPRVEAETRPGARIVLICTIGAFGG
jgi:peptide/nickel transport system ATP-binding protein